MRGRQGVSKRSVLKLAAVSIGSAAIVWGCFTFPTTGTISGKIIYSGLETGPATVYVQVRADLGADPLYSTTILDVADSELLAGVDYSFSDVAPGAYVVIAWWDIIVDETPVGDPEGHVLGAMVLPGIDTPADIELEDP